MKMWIFNLCLLTLVYSSSLLGSDFNCDTSSRFSQRIQETDLIVTGRLLNLGETYAVVSVLKILKGFDIINEVKKHSHSNDYHLIAVKNINKMTLCKIYSKTGDDLILYLNKTNEPNIFNLISANEYGEGTIEKRIFSLLNGGMSQLTKINDPCQRRNCKFGATCQKWPGNPPVAVCHCSTETCKMNSEDGKICGSDGNFYDSECHLKRKECIIQKSIKSSPVTVCDPSLIIKVPKNLDIQQDEISSSGTGSCQDRKCPPYAKCIPYPYPHCKCPTDECSDNNVAVCGNDDMTYTNICELKKVSCKATRFIGLQHVGKCDLCKFVKCEFNGVCEMNADNTGTSCKCPEPEKKCKTINQIPVCASDDVTYASECHMKIESCRKKLTLTLIHNGKCKQNSDSDLCTIRQCHRGSKCIINEINSLKSIKCSCDHIDCSNTLHQQICGDDGETYNNQCYMQRSSCEKRRPIHVYYEGQCDPCSDFLCPDNQVCYLDDNRQPKCKCHFNCDQEPYMPVCGNSGKTYRNVCLLKLHSCQVGYPINILSKEPCPFENNPCLGVKCMSPHQYCRVDVNGKGVCVCPESCPMIVQPVCGNDSVTYDSVCHLSRNACKTKKQISILYNGLCSEEPRCQEQGYFCSAYQVCRSDLKQTKCECPSCPDSGFGEHVCGTDGKTYRSECHLRSFACINNNKDLKVANIGACDACLNKKCTFHSICRMNRFGEPQCICPTDCNYEREPVCGSDGRTYENYCFLTVKSCAENRAISVISEGACKKCSIDCPMGQICSDGKCVCKDKCPQQKSRVCGSDGQYYEGECELKRQACIQKKTIRIDPSEASCRSSQYISDETRPSIERYITDKKSKGAQLACNCNSIGSVNSLCDLASGKCQCKPGVVGQSCDRCLFGYWQFGESGCTACSCNKFGSESIQCDLITGKCSCKPMVIGKYCSVCPTGYAMSNDGCQENYRNMDKIDADELGFEKDSFAKTYFSGNADKYLSINITFVPYNQDGIILYISDLTRSSDFLSLIMKNGHIEYRFDLGSGACTIKSQKSVILGRTHSLLAERYTRYARLVVDESDSVNGRSPDFLSSLDAGSIFVLGQTPGLKTNVLNNTNLVTDGFVGCLKSLKIVAGEETNHYLMNRQTSWIIESSNVKPNCPHADWMHNKQITEDTNEIKVERDSSGIQDQCAQHNPCENNGVCTSFPGTIYNCKCLPGFQGNTCEEEVSPIWKFQNDSYAILPTESLQLRKRLKLEIVFLPLSENGLLTFISDGHDRNPAFMSVLLRNNRIEVICRTPIGVTRLMSVEEIKIGKWNSLIVLKATKYVYLSLNQTPQPIKKRLIPKGFTDVPSHVRKKLTQFRISNQPLFFGGVDNIIHDSFATVVSLRPNFYGAIQKVTVNGEKIVLQYSDIIMHNISQWQGAPCGALHNPCSKTDPESNYCIADMNKAMCFCNPKHEHLCLKNSMQHDNPTTSNFNRKFSGQSYVKYSSTKMDKIKSTNKNNIRIKIKTQETDGIILLLKKAYTSKRHFLIIAIRNSVIEVSINLGGKNGIIRITSDQKISDSTWHNVHVIRNNRNVILLVDNRMFRGSLQRDDRHVTLETDGWLWLGGTRKSIDEFPWEYNKYLKGCIGELYVDEVAYNLISDARQNFGPVLKC